MTPVVPPYRRGGGFGSLGVRFREVVDPPALALRPETLGAWLTLGLLVAAIAAAIGWLSYRYWRRRYRRAAERELLLLQAAFNAQHEPLAALEAVPAVIKRCALHGFAREKVAPLSAERWVAFLSTTSRTGFASAAGSALVTIATRGASAVTAEEAAQLFGAARTWIRGHHADF